MELKTPSQIVAELDKYIIGQGDAKRAVAIALRNRHRRLQLPEAMRDEVTPKNILMIGPTGVGKTEIARRVSRLVDAPFIKVEATKFTEVGYVGRDVESIVRDLTDAAVSMVHDEKLSEVKERAEGLATERIINMLVEQSLRVRDARQRSRTGRSAKGSSQAQAQAQLGGGEGAAVEEVPQAQAQAASDSSNASLEKARRIQHRKLERLMAAQKLEEETVEIDIDRETDMFGGVLEFMPGMSNDEMTESFHDFLENLASPAQRNRRSRRVPVKEARRILTQEESHKLIDWDTVIESALRRVQENGVVFIDELDKIVGPAVETGPDVSGEGVQRDLLPIVEGSVVQTRYGPVKTDHVLFIAAGAFNSVRPSDLLPELQGRFPLRVELASLSQEDLEAILSQPENALTKQYQALLGTEQVGIEFTQDGIERLAEMAALLNERSEDIGARRLHTIMEQVLEEISFDADKHQGEHIIINAEFVEKRLDGLIEDEDLSKFIL